MMRTIVLASIAIANIAFELYLEYDWFRPRRAIIDVSAELATPPQSVEGGVLSF
jgi:hypothetical protein